MKRSRTLLAAAACALLICAIGATARLTTIIFAAPVIEYTLKGTETRKIWTSKDAPSCHEHDVSNHSTNSRTLKLKAKKKGVGTPEESTVLPNGIGEINCQYEWIEASFQSAPSGEANKLKRVSTKQ